MSAARRQKKAMKKLRQRIDAIRKKYEDFLVRCIRLYAKKVDSAP